MPASPRPHSRRQWLLRLSLAGNAGTALLTSAVLYRKGPRWALRTLQGRTPARLRNRPATFDHLPALQRHHVVLIGDSILAHGTWHELLTCDARNRAISGSYTADVRARLEPVLTAQPAAVIVHCGINDLQSARPAGDTHANYRAIFAALRERCPDTRSLVVPVLPVQIRQYEAVIRPAYPDIHRPHPDDVRALNDFLADLTAELGHTLVDVTPLLDRGELAPAFTDDGLHLNGAGQRALAALLQPFLR